MFQILQDFGCLLPDGLTILRNVSVRFLFGKATGQQVIALTLFFAFVGFFQPVRASDTPDDPFQSDPGLVKADKELNETYAALRKQLAPKARDSLKKEQLTWIEKRDGDALAIGENLSSSKLQRARIESLRAATEKRTIELRQRLSDTQSATPKPESLGEIREKSLKLLRDIVPVSTSGRQMKTVESPGGLVYLGNLFDSREVVALVNLAPEKPAGDSDGDVFEQYDYEQTWIRHLSFCAWEKDHWVFRQYLDNARNLEFHDRKDNPNHFVQASRKTGRHEGDHLSWYYDPKNKKLIPTNYEDWGPFYLVGNYLCTLRGFERRAMDETVWVYPYKDGKKGNLLAIYYSDIGRGELRNFSITFRDSRTGKYWSYSFSPKEEEQPFSHYTVDAVEGVWDERQELAKTRSHHAAEIEVSDQDGSIDQFCFERLTGLSRAVLDHEDWKSAQWKDTLPKLPPLKQIKLKITGDPEIIRHLQK